MAKILIVDDDVQFCRMLRMLLEAEEHAVTQAHDGIEGLKAYMAEPFDIVIVDIFMPNKEGIETIQEMKKINSAPKIISISGGGKNGIHTYLGFASVLGADKTFSKPFDPPEMIEAINTLLDVPSVPA